MTLTTNKIDTLHALIREKHILEGQLSVLGQIVLDYPDNTEYNIWNEECITELAAIDKAIKELIRD